MFKLVVCALLCAATPFGLRAQPGPGAPGAGMGQRGGFGRGPQAPVGPPAPVPPEVAMARPTQAEVDKINAELKVLVEKSSEKALLKQYESLLMVQVPRDNSAIRPTQTFVRTTARHNGFVETAKSGDFDILFEGDSITDFWQNSGTNAFNKYFGDAKVANFAVSGDTTQGVLWGLKNGEGQGHKPKAIMLMLGTNNGSQGNTGPEIAEGVGSVVYQLRQDFPEAKIMLLAIFPRGNGPTDASRLKNDEANKIIAKLHDGKHVFYTDINAKFMKENGSLIGFGGDNLHPNAEGYEIWGQAVAATLKSWAK
jgi:lysophospholipase L1-like esterase